MAEPTRSASTLRAVIDIGTNSVLMLTARRVPSAGVEVLEDRSTVCRLGEGVAQSGVLRDEAIERTLACLAEYRRRADERGATLRAVATEGLRLARDRQRFLDAAARVLGADVELVSGDEEARLSYLSVAQDAGTDEPSELRVLDIGGGSTELAVGRGSQLAGHVSHPIGSVRLTEAFVDTDPPSDASIESIAAAARVAFDTQPLPPSPVLHGLAGTVTSVGAMLAGLEAYDRDKVDGTRWSADQVTGLRDALAREDLATRQRRAGLGPKRADVIVAGATILVEALAHCGADTLVVRDRGLRYALV